MTGNQLIYLSRVWHDTSSIAVLLTNHLYFTMKMHLYIIMKLSVFLIIKEQLSLRILDQSVRLNVCKAVFIVKLPNLISTKCITCTYHIYITTLWYEPSHQLHIIYVHVELQ